MGIGVRYGEVPLHFNKYTTIDIDEVPFGDAAMCLPIAHILDIIMTVRQRPFS